MLLILWVMSQHDAVDHIFRKVEIFTPRDPAFKSFLEYIPRFDALVALLLFPRSSKALGFFSDLLKKIKRKLCPKLPRRRRKYLLSPIAAK